MMDWNNILNWRLLSGSHKFPGPDGGTCINEAAIVAAGFSYKSVSSADDCPPCFSRVLSAYAIALNDRLPDDLRQELLMPFVTRLAGTADSREIERQRFDYLMLGLVRSLAIIFRGWKDELATQCDRITSYDDAIAAVNEIALALARDLARDLALALALARDLARDLALALARGLAPGLACDLARGLALARDLARGLARDLARARDRDLALALDRDLDLDRDLALDLAIDINQAHVALLDGAMKIGKQAEPIEVGVVCDRMAAIRTRGRDRNLAAIGIG